MLDWIDANSGPLNVALTALTAIVWLAYLQLLHSSVSRNRRPMILISRSIEAGRAARLFVSNMGAEPIYIASIIADLETADTRSVAIIVNRADFDAGDSARSPLESTTEGPLPTGEFMDAGSFGGLLDQFAAYSDPKVEAGDIRRMTVTVAAATGHAAKIAAGRRRFTVEGTGDDTMFRPEAFSTEQVSGWLQRRRLRRRLDRSIRRHRG